MAGAVGYFDSFTVTTSSNTIANSPLAINGMIAGMSQLVYFIVPTIIGATVYRDFKYNTHTILYSYPFNKFDYLVGKFWFQELRKMLKISKNFLQFMELYLLKFQLFLWNHQELHNKWKELFTV
jgi:hypothetical protein